MYPICKMLLESGADPTIHPQKFNKTNIQLLPMVNPMSELLCGIFQLMFEKGVDVNKKYDYGETL